jgi:TonB family protein
MLNSAPMSRFFNQLLVVSCVVAGVAAQEPVRIDPAVAARNLLKKVEPVAPELAEMARIMGKVRMEIFISVDGKVTPTKILNGHPMLRRAVVTAVSQWEYRPYIENGTPRAVITEVEWFVGPRGRMSKQERALADYYPTQNQCRELIEQRNLRQAEAKCRDALKLAEELSPERWDDRANARTFLGYSLLYQRKLSEALPLFEEAHRANMARPNEEDTDLAVSYLNLARAYSMADRPAEASPNYEKAVTIYEAAIRALPSHADRHRQDLKAALLEWAKLNELTGDTDKARLLQEKADKLEN